jgi:hypothetical protein
MTSAIDITKPIYGTPTTQSVRDNFSITQQEISDLQDNRTPLWPYLPIKGGIMTGKITLDADPVSNLHAASKQYVDNLAFAQSGTVPEAPKDGWFYTRGGGTVPTDNNNWSHGPVFNIMQIAQAYNTPLYAIGSDVTNNYYGFSPSFVDALAFNRTSKILHFLFTNTSVADFSATGINFLQPVTVTADPTANLGVATKQYVDTKVLTGAATIIVSDTAPVSPSNNALWWDSVGTQLYLWYNDGNSTQWVNTTNAGFGALNSDAPLDGMLYGRRSGTWSQAATDVSIQNNIGRNVLHNGLMRIAQRGTTVFNSSGYTLDRWRLDLSLDTTNVQQIDATDTQRAQSGDEAVSKLMFVGVTGNAGAGSFTEVQQYVEDVRRLAGKTVIVSFWAYASTGGTPKIGVAAAQYFGSGGTPSAAVSINGTPVTISGTMARYSVPITFPSASGKTLGTNNDHYSRIIFFLSSGATNNTFAGGIGVQAANFLLWGVQCEIAQPGQTQPTPLEKLDYRIDLSNCQRFYFFANGGIWFGIGATGATQNCGGTVMFPTTMRAPPTVAFSNTIYGNSSGITAYATSPMSTGVYAVAAAAGNVSFTTALTASADL